MACGVCGHKQLDASFSPEELGRMYTNHYPRAALCLDEFRPSIERDGIGAWFDGVNSAAYRWVPRKVRVLDIGCGYGETLGYHLARGCEVYGVEADENIRKVAVRFGYNVHVGLFDPAMYQPDFFDYVTLDQVIEHVTEPLRTLKDIATVLRPGGMLIVATPNSGGWGATLFGRRWISWHTPYHLQLFSRESMTRAANLTGFSLDKTMTVTSSHYLHMQWNHLVMRAGEGEKSPFWRPEEERTGLQNLALKALHSVYKLKLNHVITRVFDALNLGDNHLFFLRKT
jgi:SAM-dependent methyltransferase